MWYCVSPAHKQKFERMAQSIYPELHRTCPAFLRHKDVMVSPHILKNHGVEYTMVRRVLQRVALFAQPHCVAILVDGSLLIPTRIAMFAAPLTRAHPSQYHPQAKQEPNEFIVLNAAAYHAGYNMGFNCAEAINFAMKEWVSAKLDLIITAAWRWLLIALKLGALRLQVRGAGCRQGAHTCMQ